MTYRPTRDLCRPRAPSLRGLRDNLQEHHAHALARELTHWWHGRGFPQVEFRAERLSATKAGDLWGVRGNLHNGLPPRADMPRAAPQSVQDGVDDVSAVTGRQDADGAVAGYRGRTGMSENTQRQDCG